MAEHDHRAMAPVTAIALRENHLGPAKILAGMVSDAVGVARATKSPFVFKASPTWTDKDVQKIVPTVCRLVVEAMERGIVRFPEAALFVRDYIAKDTGQAKADAMPLALIQGAYISLQGRYKHLGTTPKLEVVCFESLAELQQKCGGVR